MAFEDLFKLTTREERQKRELEYQNKIFPLGLGQRDAALAALRPHIRRKIADADVLFAFVTAKQAFLEGGPDPLMKSGTFNDFERSCLTALVYIDSVTGSLNLYPGPEEVLRRMSQTMKDAQP